MTIYKISLNDIQDNMANQLLKNNLYSTRSHMMRDCIKCGLSKRTTNFEAIKPIGQSVLE